MFRNDTDAKLRIGLRPRLVTLGAYEVDFPDALRIGLRPRLVTLHRLFPFRFRSLRIGLRPRLVTLASGLVIAPPLLRIGLRPRLVTLRQGLQPYAVGLRIGLRPRLVTLVADVLEVTAGCGLVSGQDWLHWIVPLRLPKRVADWSQAKIGYTLSLSRVSTKLLRIGLRPRLVTLPKKCE